MNGSNLKTQLLPSIQISTQDIKLPIYREFSCQDDRDNFLNGNIWFAGPNQNRFFVSEKRRDAQEYLYAYHTERIHISASHLFKYTLSFSTEIPRCAPNCSVKIEPEKINAFINLLLTSLKNKTGHKVSWLNIEQLKTHEDTIPTLSEITSIHNPHLLSEIIFSIFGIGTNLINYGEKSTRIENNHIPDSHKMPEKCMMKDKKFKEKEFRIFIDGNFEENVDAHLYHLIVKHLQFKCQNISEYCEKL